MSPAHPAIIALPTSKAQIQPERRLPTMGFLSCIGIRVRVLAFIEEGPEADDAAARLQPFSAQLGVHLALAMRSRSVVLLALVDHLLPALGQGRGQRPLHAPARVVCLLRVPYLSAPLPYPRHCWTRHSAGEVQL